MPGAGSSKAAGLSKSFNVLSPYGLARTCVAVGPSGGVRTHAPGAIVGGSWAHSYFLSTLHCPRLTHEAMLIDPKAELGETMLPVMLSPPLPANENPPLATTGGGSSVRLEAPAPSKRSHETLATMLFRIVNSRRANFQAAQMNAPQAGEQ